MDCSGWSLPPASVRVRLGRTGCALVAGAVGDPTGPVLPISWVLSLALLLHQSKLDHELGTSENQVGLRLSGKVQGLLDGD